MDCHEVRGDSALLECIDYLCMGIIEYDENSVVHLTTFKGPPLLIAQLASNALLSQRLCILMAYNLKMAGLLDIEAGHQ
jgi:hypothetical protein